SDMALNPFSSGTRLRLSSPRRDMIRAIRACKTAAEERAVVRRECAAIRAAISGDGQDLRHRNMAKLMFIHMLGYPTHFGQMECLKLIAAAGYPEKRIGYLGLMLLLDERQEVLMLVTNSLKQDLNHSNQFIVGLALCALGNICSAEMARDLAPEVERLMRSRDANTKKKEKHHGVLISAVQLCTELCKASKDALEYLRKVATKTESNKNAGNAILYECVETIMGIEATSGLRVLAINILGRFLSNRDNNIRYVALNILMRAITVDAQAVQRHRVTILECVKELVDYLQVADPDFKEDLTAKICSIAEKFSQEKLWYLDQMFKVLSLAGNHVKDDGSLLRVAVWCIGEYGEMLVNNVGMLEAEGPITVTESDAVDAVELGLNRYSPDVTTRSMCLVALLKLSSRFPSMSE
uniref:Clathrin/coatomer adaptor adaptin-like N-terminal domain-containing protein n=1 Tax=Aegilops tauschii subsp. strangulata TaxID=200361 RepID=A0A453PYT3_AEGTS